MCCCWLKTNKPLAQKRYSEMKHQSFGGSAPYPANKFCQGIVGIDSNDPELDVAILVPVSDGKISMCLDQSVVCLILTSFTADALSFQSWNIPNSDSFESCSQWTQKNINHINTGRIWFLSNNEKILSEKMILYDIVTEVWCFLPYFYLPLCKMYNVLIFILLPKMTSIN